jgi:glucokinase
MTAGLAAGVDLGGTKIQAVAVEGGKVLGECRVLTPQSGATDVIAAIVDSIAESSRQAGGTPADLVGTGIGSPGDVNILTGVVSDSANVPGFRHEVPLGPAVSEALGGVPVMVENDVRVAMLGEHERGAGRGYANALGVFVGTGVGGGLILDGQMLAGRGSAGEIGHTTVMPGGRRCSDGKRGHLEAYAGRGRMEARARRQVSKGASTILFDVMRSKGRSRLSSGVFAKALRKKDRMATTLIDDAVWALGIALANAQNLLDLEAIIVGGGLGDRLGQSFADRIATAMQPQLFAAERPPVVLTTELGDLSGAIGAAILGGR